MARISYSEMQTFSGDSSNSSQVGFFSLKRDGEEAVVRFLHDSVDDFDIITRHNVGENKNYRTVNCLRTPTDPVEKCPFCAAQIPVKQAFYIRILQYTKDATGKIVTEAKIWERNTSYATKLKSYIENYGPLSDIICKVIRHGTGLETDYEIVPNLNKSVYRDDLFPKKTELFDGYSVVGRAVLDKSFADMQTYLQTGSFPANQTSKAATPADSSVDVPFDVDVPVTPTLAVTPTVERVAVPKYVWLES